MQYHNLGLELPFLKYQLKQQLIALVKMANPFQNRLVKTNTIIIFVLIVSYGCGTYKINKSSVFYGKEQIDKIMESNFTSSELNKVPIKLRAALSKDFVRLTSDSVAIFTSGNNNVLFKLFGENKRKDSGYFVVNTNERGTQEYVCILYVIKDRRITFSHYKLPKLIIDDRVLKSYLIPDNGVLRLGGKKNKS